MPSVVRRRPPPRVKNAIYIALQKGRQQRMQVSEPIETCGCTSIPNDSGDSSPARPEKSSGSRDSPPAQLERSSPAARNGSATDSHLMSPWEQYSRLAALSKDDRPLAHVLEWHPLLRQTPAFASCLETWIAYPTKALEYAILQEASCWPDVRQKACVVPSTLKPDRHSIFAAFERSVSSR